MVKFIMPVTKSFFGNFCYESSAFYNNLYSKWNYRCLFSVLDGVRKADNSGCGNGKIKCSTVRFLVNEDG